MTKDIFSENQKELIKPLEDKGLPIPYDPLKSIFQRCQNIQYSRGKKNLRYLQRCFKEKDRSAAQKLAISNLKLVVKIALNTTTRI